MIFQFRQTSIDFTSAAATLMAIMNVTPDSFHDGGKLYNQLDNIVAYADRMIKDGADIIDIGGESTRPGATPVSAEEELGRVMPVVESLIKEFGDSVVLSVDTLKPSVADAALDAGVQIINDVSGMSDEMFEVLAKHKCPCYVLTHPGYDIPKNSADTDINQALLPDMISWFKKKIDRLNSVGITQIIIDPGFGFHKTMADNYYILNNLDFFKRLGLPILVGMSHKSMIGKVLPPDCDRLSGTLALNTIAITKGASILRVHDIEPHTSVLRVLDALNKYN